MPRLENQSSTLKLNLNVSWHLITIHLVRVVDWWLVMIVLLHEGVIRPLKLLVDVSGLLLLGSLLLLWDFPSDLGRSAVSLMLTLKSPSYLGITLPELTPASTNRIHGIDSDEEHEVSADAEPSFVYSLIYYYNHFKLIFILRPVNTTGLLTFFTTFYWPYSWNYETTLERCNNSSYSFSFKVEPGFEFLGLLNEDFIGFYEAWVSSFIIFSENVNFRSGDIEVHLILDFIPEGVPKDS